MQRGIAFPSQEFVWTVLAPRIEVYLTERKLTILELMGLYRLFGPPGAGFTGELEGDEAIKELTGQTVISFCEDLLGRIQSAASERKAGRPCDVLTRALGPRLLDLFLRYNPSAGRHSVWTSIDRKLVQEEAGPFFGFVEAAIKPINDYLIGDPLLPCASRSGRKSRSCHADIVPRTRGSSFNFAPATAVGSKYRLKISVLDSSILVPAKIGFPVI